MRIIQYTIICYLFYSNSSLMKSQTLKQEQQGENYGFPRKFGIIILTDNRNQAPVACLAGTNDYKNSGFKQTEVDPLEFDKNRLDFYNQEAVISKLHKKLQGLEKRVEQLESRNRVDSLQKIEDLDEKRKRKRRKFDQLQRKFACLKCQKMYGSETSLKFHEKLKHETH